MVQMTATLNAGGMAKIRREIRSSMRKLMADELVARREASSVATRVTRESFHYIGRPTDVPERPGRKSMHGKFARYLSWVTVPGPDGDVEFDLAGADRQVRYWIILEIGTGEHAVIRRGGQPNPRGRPGAGNTYVRTVKSQKGRFISTRLGFASSPNGVYTPGTGPRDQQLYLLSNLTGPRGGKVRRNPKRKLYIEKEIVGQNFVKKGGQAGFRVYQTSVLAAARRAFEGRGV